MDSSLIYRLLSPGVIRQSIRRSSALPAALQAVLPSGYGSRHVRQTSAHSSEFAFQFECQDDGASNLGGVAIGMKINHAALPHRQLAMGMGVAMWMRMELGEWVRTTRAKQSHH